MQPMAPRAGRLLALEPRRRRPAAPAMLERAADLLERRAARCIALLQREAGKTLDDAVAEVREAIDFCRYYASRGAQPVRRGRAMPGPTGESNVLACAAAAFSSASARGIFRSRSSSARSPRRSLAGNAVVAKPAEQTPLIACEAVRLLHEAGVPASALHLVPGDGESARRSSPHPASPASPSPARPRSRARSTARWPPRTARSCR